MGLRASVDPDGRARLALEELLRTGAFERSVLLVVTPTGTGWVDPGAILPMEYLTRGDIATVAAQHSYLSSPFALFLEVYGHWSSLPSDERPELHLHGVSLGALNSSLSFDL